MALTVQDAKDRNVCRICEGPIMNVGPENWKDAFEYRGYPPPRIVLMFGEEFAHESCLYPKRKKKEKKVVDENESPLLKAIRENAGVSESNPLKEAAEEVGRIMNDDTSGLKQLGSKTTEYKFTGPSKEMLEHFPNPKRERRYSITHETKEFTSLCPKTGQPDFAEVVITYDANERCVESKSLKLYLFSFRGEGAFMESICNRICDDLVAILDPTWITVHMTFGARGGITTKVIAHHERPVEYVGTPSMQPILNELQRLKDLEIAAGTKKPE